jgi:hypothetical protein
MAHQPMPAMHMHQELNHDCAAPCLGDVAGAGWPTDTFGAARLHASNMWAGEPSS